MGQPEPGDRAELFARLRVPSVRPDLLNQALTHSSYLNENPGTPASNERLEFLGDAILGFVVARLLFERCPEAGEGELTRIRAEIVRGSTLAQAAARIGLGQYLILGRGEEAAGGRTRERNLAGALEALVGAVYLDRGLRAAAALIRRLLREEIDQAIREGVRPDAKSSLQHLAQARWHEPPEYVTVEHTADAPARRFVVEVKVAGQPLGRGEGRSKREAQQRAAQAALEGLRLKEGAACI
ncbi:MAG: ribonuclease III [Dehalococcoidia bacterium]|nr:ribonuclease III [Dehalococcoidia bacterium]